MPSPDAAGIPAPETRSAASPEVLSEAEKRFDRARRALGLWLAPAAAALVWFLPLPLEPDQQHLAAILALVVVAWITEAVPLPVPALLGPILCVVAGIASAKAALAPIANPVTFLLMGGFFIAQAMIAHGLNRRLALGILASPWLNSSPARLMTAFGAVAAALSLIISNTAATAMMYPIALGMLAALSRGLDPKRAPALSAYATGMLLMAAYGSSVGGLGTLIGTPPNAIGAGFIAQTLGRRISFLEWMTFGLPIAVLLFAGLALLLHFLHGRLLSGAGFRSDPAALHALRAHIASERASLGRLSRGERNVLLVFLLALFLWLLPGLAGMAFGTASRAYALLEERLPDTIVALLAAFWLFVLPVDWKARRFTLEWREAARIDWGTLLLFGGGMALGDMMFKTGLAEKLGAGLVSLLAVDGLWALTGLSIALAIVLSELTSNTASATMVIPVMMAMAQTLGVDPLPPAIGACLGASFGFMLPISTAPNAIVYGSGLIPLPRMLRAGIVFDVLGFFLIWGGLRILLPALGY